MGFLESEEKRMKAQMLRWEQEERRMIEIISARKMQQLRYELAVLASVSSTVRNAPEPEKSV